MRASVVGVALAAVLLLTGVASGATSFSDSVGDDNAAPDITSVAVSEPVAGTLSVVVSMRNYREALPGGSWFNVWFDLDKNPQTGDGTGDEALVRFLSEGEIEHYFWNGTAMTEGPATGMTASFAAGVLTLSIPQTGHFAVPGFGILAVGARGQQLSGDLFVASDFAPNTGRSPWTSPTPGSFPDPENDQAAAPDIAQVRVTDAKDRWIRFAVSTPNRATLPGESAIVVTIDADNNPRTGSSGAEVSLTNLGGELELEKWNPTRRAWAADKAPTRIRERSQANVIIMDIHGSELASTPRFGFKLTSLDVNVAAGEPLAVDFAPNNGSWWRYALANPVAVRLLAGKAVGAPPRPRAGVPFTVSVPVRRSDTNQAIAAGTVTCKVLVAGKRVRAKGSIRAGKARCKLVVPRTGATVRGSLTVRSGGAMATSRFSFRVR